MSSKNQILRAIQQNKPAVAELPAIPDFVSGITNLDTAFQQSLAANSGSSVTIKKAADINAFVKSKFPEAKEICSLVPDVEGNVDITKIVDPHELNTLDLAIIKGELGVAENAAIWLSEKTLVQRVLPCIAQHLIILLDKKDLVENMHQAYAKIKVDEDGYGVFIAGPSKTADIEQTLVIGAHGARSLFVGLLD